MKKTIGSVLALVMMVSVVGSIANGTTVGFVPCREDTYPVAIAKIKAEQEKLAVQVQFGDASAAAKLSLVNKLAKATSAEHMNQILLTLTAEEQSLARQIASEQENEN